MARFAGHYDSIESDVANLGSVLHAEFSNEIQVSESGHYLR